LKNYKMKKKILITGSGSGLGLEIAKALDKKKYTIIINLRTKKKLTDFKKKYNFENVICADLNIKKDLTNISNYVQNNFGKIDILICNAGGNIKGNNNSLNSWKKIFDKNFWSTLNIIKFLEKKISNNGKIICISSICGKEFIEGAPINYSVAKSAINSFVKFYSHEFRDTGKTINAIVPGNLMFPGSVWDKKIINNKKEVKKYIKKNVPINDFGKTTDIVEMIDFLANQKSKFINGSCITLDGGQTKSI